MAVKGPVADGIGLSRLPKKTPLAREPITDLPESPALSILRNAPDTFEGRKLGIYIADGGDAKIVTALKKAAKDAGAMTEIIAPHVGGAKLSDGKITPADQKIDGAPSVVYDAVAIVMGETLEAGSEAVEMIATQLVDDQHENELGSPLADLCIGGSS